MEIKLHDGVPSSEFSEEFAQGMADAMSASYFVYGRVADAYPMKVDAIASLETRLELYKHGGTVKNKETGLNEWIEPGNPRYLIDVSNFAMIKFMTEHLNDPRLRKESLSPGRTRYDGEDIHAKNTEEEIRPAWTATVADVAWKNRTSD